MLMFLTVPVTDKEVKRLLNNQRVVFKNVDPQSGTVRDSFLACNTCERNFRSMRELANTPDCPGEPAGYTEKGAPYWNDAKGYPNKEEAEHG